MLASSRSSSLKSSAPSWDSSASSSAFWYKATLRTSSKQNIFHPVRQTGTRCESRSIRPGLLRRRSREARAGAQARVLEGWFWGMGMGMGAGGCTMYIGKDGFDKGICIMHVSRSKHRHFRQRDSCRHHMHPHDPRRGEH